jgi:hypothetical protein
MYCQEKKRSRPPLDTQCQGNLPCQNVWNRATWRTQARAPKAREAKFEHAEKFPRILEHLNAASLVSTWQGGQLIVVGVWAGKLTFAFLAYKLPPRGLPVRP